MTAIRWCDVTWNPATWLAQRLPMPLSWRKPRRIAVGELFDDDLTNEQIAAVFGVMAACPQHTFQVLTKRAKRMREWFAWVQTKSGSHFGGIPAMCFAKACEHEGSDIANLDKYALYDARSGTATWPLPNVWLGVSVENQAAADERIPDLLATPAAVRFLSCEPLLGPIDVAGSNGGNDWLGDRYDDAEGEDGIDWVIAGCESGPGARPAEVDWYRSLRDQCEAAGVPFFLKQAVETDMGVCGDADNPNGDDPCGQRVRYYVRGPKDSSVSCGCTVEGPEDANGCPPIGAGDGSKRKPGGVIGLPYLDGMQHAAFPAVKP